MSALGRHLRLFNPFSVFYELLNETRYSG